jgi:tetratricopeptide (TPR) repeat protein
MVRWCSAALLLHAVAAFAIGPRISFTRVIPAPHDLAPAESIAVIYAIGDNEKVTSFVQRFVEYVERGGTLRTENAVEDNQNLTALDEAALKRLRRVHPADVYIGVSLFTCTGKQHSAQGSERDVSGDRVRRLHMWVDAVCQARLDVRSANGRRLFTINARGEGTSPRAISLSDEERDVAYEQAARYAALNAADMITPRVVRESIELEETAPAFEEGWTMIRFDRLDEARVIWEAALRQHRDSAPLLYNLGALCEAIGDVPSANRYLQSAVKLSPRERRYRNELELLRRRSK